MCCSFPFVRLASSALGSDRVALLSLHGEPCAPWYFRHQGGIWEMRPASLLLGGEGRRDEPFSVRDGPSLTKWLGTYLGRHQGNGQRPKEKWRACGTFFLFALPRNYKASVPFHPLIQAPLSCHLCLLKKRNLTQRLPSNLSQNIPATTRGFITITRTRAGLVPAPALLAENWWPGR